MPRAILAAFSADGRSSSGLQFFKRKSLPVPSAPAGSSGNRIGSAGRTLLQSLKLSPPAATAAAEAGNAIGSAGNVASSGSIAATDARPMHDAITASSGGGGGKDSGYNKIESGVAAAVAQLQTRMDNHAAAIAALRSRVDGAAFDPAEAQVQSFHHADLIKALSGKVHLAMRAMLCSRVDGVACNPTEAKGEYCIWKT